MADVRMYCSDNYKRMVKATAAEKGITMSELLSDAVKKAFPHISELEQEEENATGFRD